MIEHHCFRSNPIVLNYVCLKSEINMFKLNDPACELAQTSLFYFYLIVGTTLGKMLTSLFAAKSVVYDNTIILTGGYNNTLNSLVYKITLPDDLCTLSSDFNSCSLVYGCAARVIHHANGENVTLCNRNDRQAPERYLVNIYISDSENW